MLHEQTLQKDACLILPILRTYSLKGRKAGTANSPRGLPLLPHGRKLRVSALLRMAVPPLPRVLVRVAVQRKPILYLITYTNVKHLNWATSVCDDCRIFYSIYIYMGSNF